MTGLPFGRSTSLNGVTLSLHPAGHILGSAQVRIEHAGEVWVVSGDYKTVPDPTTTAFESVRCHTFVTESTFGLPIYRWPPQDDVRPRHQCVVERQSGRRQRRACCTATPWERRSGCWRGSTRP